ncbi:hypothetical protein [Aquiflexum gelatinilyticum]|jgi:hypothetical protein|uniref:Uncharacterized protein n=1 Tax=Aquiflexum gelatinilyticum TaxID=2961943 RepID=A0A9X2P3B1_9BACT|nr:hypothetical protein [Aquiflexum gelatinilyticum]MCR9015011.1 hypothetical protein [Aquiflexum gelatinilyticum]
MISIENEKELLALLKALEFVKYQSKDYESRYLAGSPIIGELYRKISESLHKYYEEIHIPYSKEWVNIESIPAYLNVISNHIANIDNWKDLSEESKIEVVKVFIYPFKVEDSTLVKLIETRNL